MTFNLPTLFKSALKFLRDKVLVPTSLGSKELKQVEAGVKRRAIFSARVTQIRVLQVIKDAVDKMLNGEANLAEGKLEIGKVLDETGYTAAEGFPQDAPGTVPPAVEDSLRDLRSEERKKLQLATQYRIAANEAYVASGLTQEARFTYPAWELVRIARRTTPRGLKRLKAGLVPDPGQDWQTRWVAAGGELWDRGTRMIARKDSTVWQALGDGAGGYDDTLGNPFPPFAFNSGYGIREVHRSECLELGVIDEDEELAEARRAVAEGRMVVPAQEVDDETLAWFKELKRKRATGEVESPKVGNASDYITLTVEAGSDEA